MNGIVISLNKEIMQDNDAIAGALRDAADSIEQGMSSGIIYGSGSFHTEKEDQCAECGASPVPHYHEFTDEDGGEYRCDNCRDI